MKKTLLLAVVSLFLLTSCQAPVALGPSTAPSASKPPAASEYYGELIYTAVADYPELEGYVLSLYFDDSASETEQTPPSPPESRQQLVDDFTVLAANNDLDVPSTAFDAMTFTVTLPDGSEKIFAP